MSTRNQNIITHLIQTISATFHTHPLRGLGGFLLPLWGLGGCLLLLSCSDWNDMGTETIPDGTNRIAEEGIGIAFSSSVAPSHQATRADATIINMGETSLLPTATSNRRAGIFGCYTGPYHWASLVMLYDVMADGTITSGELADLKSKTNDFDSYDSESALQTDAPTILNKYYSANLMFNVPATINSDGSLTYTPLQFWSNNPLPSPATGHEYMTFFAYYPYNESSTLGEYGISMFNDENGIGPGKGMGKVKFTMHSDARNHNDFLISAPVTDCNRDKYPLIRTDNTPTYSPTPVQFSLYHMLAQVRFYVFINGLDKMVYQSDVCTQDMLDTWNDGTNKFTDSHLDTEATKKYFRKSDATKDGVAVGMWLEEGVVIKGVTIDAAYITAHGELKPAVKNEYNAWIELKEGDQIPDESQCVRWKRGEVWNLSHTGQRPDLTYTMELNNIHTTATFFPQYTLGGATIAYDDATTLGSTTVNHYVMNPYWFTFQYGKRVRLNDNYMFGYFEDTPVANQFDATDATTLKAATDAADLPAYNDYDGWDWTGTDDPLDYLRLTPPEFLKELEGNRDDSWKDPSDHSKGRKHYNYAPGNILLVVPQTLSDDDVPHVVITAHGYDATTNAELTAKVTVNLLKMGISWESGYVYCYAFLDELRPGDDKVRGPESITTLINKEWRTDQW